MARFDFGHNMLQISSQLHRGRPITARWIRDEYEVSAATAKRYMTLVEASLPVACVMAPCPEGRRGRHKVLRLMELAR